MAVNLDPDLWFDQEGAAADVVTLAAAGTGAITILSGDGSTGIDGLDLTDGGANSDALNAARIMKAIQEYQFAYRESLDAADKPDSMVISRSASTSGSTMYVTYSYRYQVDTESMETVAEPAV